MGAARSTAIGTVALKAHPRRGLCWRRNIRV